MEMITVRDMIVEMRTYWFWSCFKSIRRSCHPSIFSVTWSFIQIIL